MNGSTVQRLLCVWLREAHVMMTISINQSTRQVALGCYVARRRAGTDKPCGFAEWFGQGGVQPLRAAPPGAAGASAQPTTEHAQPVTLGGEHDVLGPGAAQ